VLLVEARPAGRASAPVRYFFMFPLAFSMPTKIILVPRTLALGVLSYGAGRCLHRRYIAA
jgi:hypothetical protein